MLGVKTIIALLFFNDMVYGYSDAKGEFMEY